jgi:orotate phosphoribosyltransferase
MDIEKHELLRSLVTWDIIQLGEFKLKSGASSDYYFQSRNIPSLDYDLGQIMLKDIAREMGKVIREYFPRVEKLVGIAYAGISLALAITIEIGIPSCYTRKEVKSHGIPTYIEGHIKNGEWLLIIDDVLTTGESVLETIDLIKEEGKQRNIEIPIMGVVCLFNREEGGDELLNKQGIYTASVFKKSDLVGFNRDWI